MNLTKLEKSRSCDFKNVMRGSRSYLKVKINSGGDWLRIKKAVGFRSAGTKEDFVPLDAFGECVIPQKFCDKRCIYITLYGNSGNSALKTNEVPIYLD